MFQKPLEVILTFCAEEAISMTLAQLRNTKKGQKFLKRIGLDKLPDANDFEGLYRYTFLDYAVGRDRKNSKNKAVINLFSDEGLKTAFDEAFDTNSQIVIMDCLDVLYEANQETNELKGLSRQEAEQELGRFRTIFDRTIQETRDKYDVLREHKQNAQHNEILDKVDTLTKEVAATEQWNNLRENLSGYLEEDLARIQKSWDVGHIDDVLSGLQSKREDRIVWETLPKVLRATWLRTEAIFLLEIKKDIASATELSQLAQYHHPEPTEDGYIEALIAFCESDFEQALEIVRSLATERAVHLRAVTLIEMKHYDEAQKVLDFLESSPSIHVHFTRTRLALLNSNVELALQTIQTALKHAPNSPDIKFWYAQTKYLSALSPAVQPKVLQILPEPIIPIFIRDMPQYVERLQEAESIFTELEREQTGERWKSLPLWTLACSFLLSDNREDLVARCQKLIDEHPLGDIAATWAANYILPVDYNTAIDNLKSKISNSPGTTNQIISLAACYLHTNRVNEAIDLLLKSKSIFEPASIEVWYHNLISAYFANGDYEQAEHYINQISDETEKTAKLLLLHRIRDDNTSLHRYLQTEPPQNALLLLELCDVAAKLGNWSYVSSNSEILFEKINTRYAFNLIVESTYQAHDFEKCLAYINEISDVYYPRRLPCSYHNLRVRCLMEIGRFKQAYDAKTEIFNDCWNTDSFTTLVTLLQSVGDLDSFLPLAQKLLQEKDYPATYRLKVAEIVSLLNLDLAIQLWRETQEQDIPDDMLGYAVMLANTLGVKAETEDLFHQIHSSVNHGKSGIQIMKLENLGEFIQNQQTFQKDVNEAYSNSEAPIHVVTGLINFPLTWFYHERLKAVTDAASLHPSLALLTRHGGRPVLRKFDLSSLQGHVAFDITTVLLAYHFDILQELEDTFSPLHISSLLIPALLKLTLQYHATDRERIEACQQITLLATQNPHHVINPSLPDNCDENLLNELGKDWVALYNYVKNNNAYFINFSPIRKKGLSTEVATLPLGSEPFIADIRAILNALLKYKIVTRKEYDGLVHSLGTSAHSDNKIELRPPPVCHNG